MFEFLKNWYNLSKLNREKIDVTTIIKNFSTKPNAFEKESDSKTNIYEDDEIDQTYIIENLILRPNFKGRLRIIKQLSMAGSKISLFRNLINVLFSNPQFFLEKENTAINLLKIVLIQNMFKPNTYNDDSSRPPSSIEKNLPTEREKIFMLIFGATTMQEFQSQQKSDIFFSMCKKLMNEFLPLEYEKQSKFSNTLRLLSPKEMHVILQAIKSLKEYGSELTEFIPYKSMQINRILYNLAPKEEFSFYMFKILKEAINNNSKILSAEKGEQLYSNNMDELIFFGLRELNTRHFRDFVKALSSKYLPLNIINKVYISIDNRIEAKQVNPEKLQLLMSLKEEFKSLRREVPAKASIIHVRSESLKQKSDSKTKNTSSLLQKDINTEPKKNSLTMMSNLPSHRESSREIYTNSVTTEYFKFNYSKRNSPISRWGVSSEIVQGMEFSKVAKNEIKTKEDMATDTIQTNKMKSKPSITGKSFY